MQPAQVDEKPLRARPPEAPAAATPTAPSAVPDLTNPALYINRETSWLAFNERVLDQARDARWPLLERLKFLAIYSSNLDEFFMIRVSGLHEQLEAAALVEASPDGLSARDQLTRIGQIVRAQLDTADRGCWPTSSCRAGRARHPHPRLGHAGRRHQAPGAQVLPAVGVPGGHAAGRRSGAPVPVPVEPVAVAGRRGARPRDEGTQVRAHQGPGDPAALPAARATGPQRALPRAPRGARISCRWSSCWPPTWTSCSPAWRSWAPIRSASRATWTSTSSRKRPPICCPSSTARCGGGGSAPASAWRCRAGSPSASVGC